MWFANAAAGVSIDRRSLRTAAVAGLLLLLTIITAPFPCPAGQNPTLVTSYAAKGVFMESRSAGRIAVIAHEKIPGYMDAMTMPFTVKKPAEIKKLRPGDEIRFRLSVTDREDWIDEIKRVGRRRTRVPHGAVHTDNTKEIGMGGPLPECTLTNQAGHRFQVTQFKGQALALTFFFSRCPLPSFCPRMNNNFLAVQQALQAEPARTNWQLISISFDPSFDTPQQLSDFAKLHQNSAYHWDFATSSSEEIRKLGAAFGLKFWRENGSLSHNLRTVVVNCTGRIQRVFTGNEWQPSELVDEMRKAMAGTK